MNRNAIINDLNNLASKAQRHYKVSRFLGGGGGTNFDGLQLSPGDQSNNNGEYRFMSLAEATTKAASAPVAVEANTLIPASSSTTTIYIVGFGTEVGDDNIKLVQVYVTVTSNSVTASVVN